MLSAAGSHNSVPWGAALQLGECVGGQLPPAEGWGQN